MVLSKMREKIRRNIIPAAVIFMLLIGIAFLYAMFVPITVVKDWRINVDNNKVYRPGEAILVKNQFTKVREATGISTHYIECKDTFGNYNTKQEINESEVKRPAGATAEDIQLVIPSLTVPTPTTCRIHIIRIYHGVNGFRTVIVNNYSNEFFVDPPQTTGTIEITLPPYPASDNQVVENAPVTPHNGTGNAKTQPAPQSQPAPQIQQDPSPSVLERARNGIVNLFQATGEILSL